MDGRRTTGWENWQLLAALLFALAACEGSGESAADGGGGGIPSGLPSQADEPLPDCTGATGAVLVAGEIGVELPEGALSPCLGASPALSTVEGGPGLAASETNISAGGLSARVALGTDEPISLQPDEGAETPIAIALPYDDSAVDPALEDDLHIYVVAHDPDADTAVPLFGALDTEGNYVWLEVTGLPPTAVFTVVYNPDMAAVSSNEVGGPAGELGRREGALTASDWPTNVWCVAYDATNANLKTVVAGILGVEAAAVTAEQIRSVLADRVAKAARELGSEYQALKFRAPYLYAKPTDATTRACSGGSEPVYYVHMLYAGGSFFRKSEPLEAADMDGLAGIGNKFGRLYIDVDRLDDGADTALGSVRSSIAHELFHGIHAGYEIYVSGHRVRSITEGTATTVGKTFDGDGDRNSVPQVRSYADEVFPLSSWLLAADPSGDWRYKAADFFAYVTRRHNGNSFDWLPTYFAAVRNKVKALPAAQRVAPPVTALYAALDEGIRTGIHGVLDLPTVYFDFATDRLVEHTATSQFGRAGEETRPGALAEALLNPGGGLLPALTGDPDSLDQTEISNGMHAYSTRVFRVTPSGASDKPEGVRLTMRVAPAKGVVDVDVRIRYYRAGSELGVDLDDGELEIGGWAKTADDALIVVVSNTSTNKDESFEYSAKTAPMVEEGPCEHWQAEGTYVPRSVDIRDQGDLDELRGCTKVDALTIRDAAGVTDLRGLESLQEIRFSLTIRSNPDLTSLDGLDGLTTLEGYLAMDQNPKLRHASFPALTTIGGEISLGPNEVLEVLELNALTEAKRGIHLEEMPALATVGLAALHTSGGSTRFEELASLGTLSLPALVRSGSSETGLSIHDCDALTSVSIPALAEMTGRLGVSLNDRLATFSAPALAGEIHGVSISQNPALTSISVPLLEAVAAEYMMTGDFTIRSNDVLSDIVFSRLSRVDGEFQISSNPALPQETIDALRAQIGR